jgi:cytochrome P450
MIISELSLVAFSLVGGIVTHLLINSFEPVSIGQFLAYPFCVAIVERFLFSLAPLQILLSLFAWLSALGTSILVYRLVLPIHPLHHIPGPLFAKSTQLFQFYSLFRGRPRVDQRRLHERYGNVIRIGPNEVSIADTLALSAIFGAKSWKKGKGYSFTASGGAATSETALSAIRDHKEHTTRRKIWDRAFAIASLKSYQPSIQLRVQQLCDKLDEKCRNGPLDLQEWIGYLVFDVMTDLAWGGGGDALVKGRDPDGAIASLRYSLHVAGMTKALPWFANILLQFPWVERRTRKFRTFASEMFLRRKEKGETSKSELQKDVFYHLLGEGTSEGRQLSIGALQADSRQVVTYVFSPR